MKKLFLAFKVRVSRVLKQSGSFSFGKGEERKRRPLNFKQRRRRRRRRRPPPPTKNA
tara:strand:- start:1466 stop:1636 length:171 start_codon:yes stop_codon:yes gene_type:complete